MVNNYALHNVETLRFWCRKVLPLVYDDSLSYYEVLCKVSEKLNEVIANEDAQNDAIEALTEAVNQELATAEDKNNKVTSISATSTDTQYPSAKAVWDLAESLPSGGIKLLNVVYGVTTFEEIEQAVSDGKILILDKSGDRYYLNWLDSGITAQFSSVNGAAVQICECGFDNSWSHRTQSFADATNTEIEKGVPYVTTAPTANNTSGKLKFAVLSSEPATRYSGWFYIITT